MKPNPFKCPDCGQPAIDVDGNPFEQDRDSLTPCRSMNILISCANKHRWFEAAEFDTRTMKVTKRRTSAVIKERAK